MPAATGEADYCTAKANTQSPVKPGSTKPNHQSPPKIINSSSHDSPLKMVVSSGSNNAAGNGTNAKSLLQNNANETKVSKIFHKGMTGILEPM
jgi:hypothetical protein